MIPVRSDGAVSLNDDYSSVGRRVEKWLPNGVNTRYTWNGPV
jgi:hypothetical protein